MSKAALQFFNVNVALVINIVIPMMIMIIMIIYVIPVIIMMIIVIPMMIMIIHLDGEHFGWKYDLLRVTLSSASLNTSTHQRHWEILKKNIIVLKTVSFLARLGVCISGLCQDTSAHPRSSARITTCKFQFKSGGDFSLLFVLFQAWWWWWWWRR